MSAKINDPNVALRKANSRYKLWISFKNKSTITLYGSETTVTYNQMFFGRIREVMLDRMMGFENCKLMAEKFYSGKYITAIIYDTVTDRPVRKYVADVVDDLEVVKLTGEERFSYYITKVENDRVILLEDPSKIDFKKEVKTALQS